MNNYNPVQSDMFATFDKAPVESVIATNEKPPVTTNSIPTLAEYTAKIALRTWPKDHTRRNNLRSVKFFSEYKDFGKLTLADIRRKHIYEFVDYLMDERGISQCSANKYMAAISKVMNIANDKEIVDNPIKLKYPKVESGRPRYFSREEQADLVQFLQDAGKHYMADMVTLSCNTGMRKGEILVITEKDVVYENGFLYLPAKFCKSGKDRYVPLNDEAKEAYYRLLLSIKCYSHRGFYRWWEKARQAVGKGDPLFVFHVCRHTAATRLANDVRVNEFVIADILGHQDTRTTRLYVHAKDEALTAAVNAL